MYPASKISILKPQQIAFQRPDPHEVWARGTDSIYRNLCAICRSNPSNLTLLRKYFPKSMLHLQENEDPSRKKANKHMSIVANKISKAETSIIIHIYKKGSVGKFLSALRYLVAKGSFLQLVMSGAQWSFW